MFDQILSINIILLLMNIKYIMLKFELSEKDTKICTIFLMLCTFTHDLLSKRPNPAEDFFQILFASQKVLHLHSLVGQGIISRYLVNLNSEQQAPIQYLI